MQEMNPRIVDGVPTDDNVLKLIFSNGVRGRYDCSPLPGFGVFEELRNRIYSEQAIHCGVQSRITA
jgi:hypothetical protein